MKPKALVVQASPTLGGRIKVSTSLCKNWKDFTDDSTDSEEEILQDEILPDSNTINSNTMDSTISRNSIPGNSEERNSMDIAPSSSQILLPPNEQTMIVDKILDMKFRSAWKYLTKWIGLSISDATWEPLSTFVEITNDGSDYTINDAFIEYSRTKNPMLLDVARRYGQRLTSKKKNARMSDDTMENAQNAEEDPDENPNESFFFVSRDDSTKGGAPSPFVD